MLDTSQYSYLIHWSAQFMGMNGLPLSAGWIEVYEAGTTNEIITYKDMDGTENPFRIPLDIQGRCVAIVDRNMVYDVYVYNFIGNLEFSRLRVNTTGEGGGGETYYAGNGINISGSNIISVDTNTIQEKLEAGDNIHIEGNVISATNTSYTAGNGISIEDDVISLDPSDIEVDRFEGYDTVKSSGTSLIGNFSISRYHGNSVEYNGETINFKEGVFNVIAQVKFTNTSIDANVYEVSLSGNTSDGSPKVAFQWDNSYIHTEIHEINFLHVSAVGGDSLVLASDACSQITGMTMQLYKLQIFCLNALSGTGGIGEVVTDSTLTGDGTALSPLGLSSSTLETINGKLSTVAVDGVTITGNGTSGSPLVAAAQPQEQADWTQTNTSAVDYIKNKPTLATVATSGSYTDLSNKPDLSVYAEKSELATVATTGDYDDLQNKPTIPAAQVNSDWNASTGVAQILNKPNLATVATSGSYNDLTDKPTIPTVSVQDVEVDGTSVVNSQGVAEIDLTDYAKKSEVPAAQEQANWTETDTTDPSYIKNKPSLATVATSGSYNDLSNKPSIPAAQVNSDWNASSGVAEILNKPSLATVATSGSYSDLSNTPTIPTATSDLTNDSGFITASDVPGAQVQSNWNETDNTDPSYIQNKPADIFLYGGHNIHVTYDMSSVEISAVDELPSSTSTDSGKVLTVDSSGDPTWQSPGSFTQAQADWTETDNTDPSYIQNKPNLATVATSGSYNDLSNTPSIPTATSDLTNDSGFITASDVPSAQEQADWNEADSSDPAYIKNKPSIPAAQVNADWNATSGVAEILNKPTIPAAQVNSDWNASSGVAEILNKPSLATVATTGSYTDLSNTPTIPDGVPTVTSSDDGKVLTADYTGGVASYSWETAPSGSTGLFEAEYGTTTYADIITAITNKNVVYCKISSGGATGAYRMAAMAYYNSTNVEFHYYRSLNPNNTGSDEVYIYAVDSSNNWTTTNRNINASLFEAVYGTTTISEIRDAEASGKIVYCLVRVGSTSTYRKAYLSYKALGEYQFTYYRSNSSGDKLFIYTVTSSGWTTTENPIRPTGLRQVPTVTSSDNGKVLKASHDGTTGSYSWQTESGGGGTVDQTYDPTSTNAQSGTAVAGAIATVNQVPTSTSVDEGKVLTVDANGDAAWNNPTLASILTTAGITDVQQVSALPAQTVSTVLYLIPET